mmetsp:Transcript_8659/g.14924  ORF Transcript_8659/g.14924 Transcript_8659/m.14924 type:complete len:184 (-) Transcript_8659:15-566(-)
MPRTKRSIQNSDDEEFVVKQPSVKKVKKVKKSPANKSSSSNAKSKGFSDDEKEEIIEKLRESVLDNLYETGFNSSRAKPYAVVPLGTYETDAQLLSLTDKLPAPKETKSFFRWKFTHSTDEVLEWLEMPSLFPVAYFGPVFISSYSDPVPECVATLSTPLTLTFDRRTRCLSAKLRMEYTPYW